jgi:hypothetical protein
VEKGADKRRGDVAGPDRRPDLTPDFKGKGRGPQGKGLDTRVTTPDLETDKGRGGPPRGPDDRTVKGRGSPNVGAPPDVTVETPRIAPPAPGRGSPVDRGARPGRGPSSDRGQSVDRGPKLDQGPPIDRNPSVDRGPKLDRGPSGDRGTKPDRGPSGERGNSRGSIDRGKGRPDRSEAFPSLPSGISPNRVDRADVPVRRGAADFSTPTETSRNLSDAVRDPGTGRVRTDPNVGQRGRSESQAPTGAPQSIVREPQVPRGQTRSPLTISPQLSAPRSADSGRAAARSSQETRREMRADPVAPLRLGGPEAAPRSLPTPAPQARARPELPSAVTRGSGRSAPSAAPPSLRIPTGAPRPREPDDDKKRLRDKN